MGSSDQKLTLHLPQGLIERLQKAAVDRHETPDEIVAELIQSALDRLRQTAPKAPTANTTMPLRGAVIRYDDPFKPAAPVHEWEASGGC